MSEFDMFNDEANDVDSELTLVEEKALMRRTSDEPPTSFHHPLSDWSPDRHRQKKLAINADPNIRL